MPPSGIRVQSNCDEVPLIRATWDGPIYRSLERRRSVQEHPGAKQRFLERSFSADAVQQLMGLLPRNRTSRAERLPGSSLGRLLPISAREAPLTPVYGLLQ